jgi:hypothetical protein
MTLLPDLVAIGLWLALLTATGFALAVVASRRLLWNPADPLLLVFLNVALNVAIVVVLADARHVDTITFVVAGFVAFLAGLHAFRSRVSAETTGAIRAPGRTATLLLLATAAAFYLVYDAFIVSQVGLGIFGGKNPDLAKVTLTQGGFGLFRHLYVAANLFYLPLLVHSFVVYRRRYVLVLGVLLFLVQNIVFNFSKAGFVFVIFDLGLLAYFYQGALGRRVLSFRMAASAALVGLGPALLVLSFAAAFTGVSVLQLILTRLAATGSGTYMYFLLDGSEAFRGIGLASRLALFFDTLLSSLRLKPWAPLSFSGMVSTQITGVELPGFGANPYPFVAGHFLFGWGGIVYCFVVGAFLSYVRTRRTNLLAFFVANQGALVFVADPAITQAYVIAMLVISPAVVLVWIVALTQRRQLMVPVRAAYTRWVLDRRQRARAIPPRASTP